MFRRRVGLTILQRGREILWPRMGWWRAGAYFRYRIVRLQGSAYSIAIGLACGAAISFTPFVGLHFVFAAFISWLIGGNVIASAIGTAVGNPWTFPFIWLGTLRLGELILGSAPMLGGPEQLSMHYIFDKPFVVLLPMSIGGVLMGILVWIAVYFISYFFIERYQRVRGERLKKRRYSMSTVLEPESGEEYR